MRDLPNLGHYREFLNIFRFENFLAGNPVPDMRPKWWRVPLPAALAEHGMRRRRRGGQV